METKIEEIWKVVDQFDNYLISSNGQIKNRHTNQIIKPSKHKRPNGTYLAIKLYRNHKRFRFSVHRLVAYNFLPNPEGKPIVCHIDNNPENNNYKNLYWGTYRENNIQAIKEGRRKSKKGIERPQQSCENHKSANLTNIQVYAIRDAIKNGFSLTKIGRYFNTTKGTIWKIKSGYSWRHLV